MSTTDASGQLQSELPGLVGEVPPECVSRLIQFLELVRKWNKVYNLTAIHTETRMVVEHALDSASIVPYVQPNRVLDVGSGAGFPGIPLAIIRPQWNVTLLDSNQKRCTFLRQSVIELALKNVDVVCERVERFRPASAFDTVVSRAFSSLAEFWRNACAMLDEHGIMLAMKGVYPEAELAHLPSAVRVNEVVRVRVPGLEANRHVVVMTKALT